MKKLSVIIVTYHSENDIFDCLQSIWKYCDIPREELEIIVVENSQESEPMFTKIKQQHGDDIILIHNTHNGGYGQGNNVGIRHASAPVIMIMNPDVRMCEPIFRTVLESFNNDKELCIYGIKQMLSEKIKSPLSFDCSRRMNGYLIPFVASLCNKFDYFIPSLMYVAGSCFFVNKEKFESIGLFNEDIFMYGEEDDIHDRFRKRFGSHFVYNPNMRYIHLTLDRPMSFDTEKKMMDSIALSYEKKGTPREKTYRNFARYYRSRLIISSLKKFMGGTRASAKIAILKEAIRYCQTAKNA